MRAARTRLLNTPEVELWPAALLRGRDNRTARALAGADWCLRRKHDGRYLAAVGVGPDRLRVTPFLPGLDAEPGADQALALAAVADDRGAPDGAAVLPLSTLMAIHDVLGVDAAYGERHALPLVAEPAALALAGFDRYRRPLWLRRRAARAWQRMQRAARNEGVSLQAISGYRSHAYQYGIFARKMARGQQVEEILRVNTAPGYSEHHGGDALDIGTPGEPPAEEGFEATPAYDWLQRRAGEFGFVMSYPRGNPHGIVYEPWHWRWHPPAAR